MCSSVLGPEVPTEMGSAGPQSRLARPVASVVKTLRVTVALDERQQAWLRHFADYLGVCRQADAAALLLQLAIEKYYREWMSEHTEPLD